MREIVYQSDKVHLPEFLICVSKYTFLLRKTSNVREKYDVITTSFYEESHWISVSNVPHKKKLPDAFLL